MDLSVFDILVIVIAILGGAVVVADVVLLVAWIGGWLFRGRSVFAPKWSVADVFVGAQLGLVGLMAVAMPIGFAIGLAGGGSGATTLGQDPLILLVLMTIQGAAFVAVPALYLHLWYRLGLRDLGLSLPHLRRGILLGLAWFVPVFVIAFGLEKGSVWVAEAVVPKGVGESIESLQRMYSIAPLFEDMTAGKFVVLLGAIAVVPAVSEEIFFRGFLFNALRIRWGIVWGIVISGIVFALVHVPMFLILPYLFISMMLAWCYARTRTLVAPMTMHFLNNALLLVLAAFGVLEP